MTPSLAPTRIRSNLPRLSNSPARSRGRRRRSWRLPSESSDAEADDAADRGSARAARSPNAPTVSPTARCCLSAVRLVDRDLVVAAAASSPSTSWSGLRLWSPCGSMPTAMPSSALPIACPSRRRASTSSSIEPCADSTPGRLSTLLSTAAEKAGASLAAVAGLDRDLGADDRVGGLVRVAVDAVEALAERVGEDEGAADHRDAEHDRERGERRAELAAEQAFEGDLDHRAVTASSASRISWADDGPRSLTIRPSARKRMRSAIAAAWASWVTITVVWP